MEKILSPSLKRKGSSSINEEAIQAPFRIWSKNFPFQQQDLLFQEVKFESSDVFNANNDAQSQQKYFLFESIGNKNMIYLFFNQIYRLPLTRQCWRRMIIFTKDVKSAAIGHPAVTMGLNHVKVVRIVQKFDKFESIEKFWIDNIFKTL